jgi:hypothetical protein
MAMQIMKNNGYILEWYENIQQVTYQCVKEESNRYKMLSESSWTVIVVTALVKDDDRGGQGHTSASLLHQSVT